MLVYYCKFISVRLDKQFRHSLALLLRLLHLSSERTISCAMAALEHPFTLGINIIQYSIQYSVLLSALPFQHVLNDQISCCCFSELSLVVCRYVCGFLVLGDDHHANRSVPMSSMQTDQDT